VTQLPVTAATAALANGRPFLRPAPHSSLTRPLLWTLAARLTIRPGPPVLQLMRTPTFTTR